MRVDIYCVIFTSIVVGSIQWSADYEFLVMELESTQFSDCPDWTDRSKTLTLIDLFRQHECLWKVNTADYSDRVKRQAALRSIAAALNVTGYLKLQ